MRVLAFALMVFSISVYHLKSERPVAVESELDDMPVAERLSDGPDAESRLSRRIASMLPPEAVLEASEIEALASCAIGRASEVDMAPEELLAQIAQSESEGQRLYGECLEISKAEAFARIEAERSEILENEALERHIASETDARLAEQAEAIALTEELAASNAGAAAFELGPPQS